MLPNVRLSESQREIVELDGNVIVQAGAGTGKTHTLVSKIIYDIERQRSHKVIAAITFTIKAAKEIRERLNVSRGDLFVGTNNSFVIEEIIQPFMKDVYGDDYNVKMSTDYSVKILSYDEGIRMVKEDHLLCTYKDNKYNFIFQLALAIVQQSAACQLYLKAKYFKIYVDEYQDCDVDMHTFFMYLCDVLEIELFVVGDERQSIYIWRGANPELFTSIRNKSNFTHRILYENFRSCLQIQNYSYLLFRETSELYNPVLDVSPIIVICVRRENCAHSLLRYIKSDQSCALIRRTNFQAESSAEAMTSLGMEFVYVPHPPIADISTDSSWLYDAIAKSFIIQEYSAYDFSYDIPNEASGNKTTVNHIRSFLSQMGKCLQDRKRDDFVQMVEQMAGYFGYEVKQQHCIMLYDTIVKEEYHAAFRADRLQRPAMTVHSSKGLEFEQVIIFLSDFNYVDDQDIYNHYVAVTRAKTKLIMVYFKCEADSESRAQDLINILERSHVEMRDVATIENVANASGHAHISRA